MVDTENRKLGPIPALLQMPISKKTAGYLGLAGNSILAVLFSIGAGMLAYQIKAADVVDVDPYTSVFASGMPPSFYSAEQFSQREKAYARREEQIEHNKDVLEMATSLGYLTGSVVLLFGLRGAWRNRYILPALIKKFHGAV